MDMVDFDENGHINKIEIKPVKTNLIYTWIIAVWTPHFTQFMHDYVANCVKTNNANGNLNEERCFKKLCLGDVFQVAIYAGMTVNKVEVENVRYMDIGTPEDLYRAV